MDTIKCVVEKVTPLIPEVMELVEAIKQKDGTKIMTLGLKLFNEGKAIYEACFTTNFLAFNWPSFLKCVGKEIDFSKIKPIVDAITSRNFPLAGKLILSSTLPIVVKCKDQQ